MTSTIKTIVKSLTRLAIVWIVDALSIFLAAWILPGINVTSVGGTGRSVVVAATALLLALVNLLIRPFVLLLARPLGWLITFIVGFLINALALWITAWLLPGFDVSFWGGIFGGIALQASSIRSLPASSKSMKRDLITRTASSGRRVNSPMTAPASRAKG